jgi:hypothetical protein
MVRVPAGRIEFPGGGPNVSISNTLLGRPGEWALAHGERVMEEPQAPADGLDRQGGLRLPPLFDGAFAGEARGDDPRPLLIGAAAEQSGHSDPPDCPRETLCLLFEIDGNSGRRPLHETLIGPCPEPERQSSELVFPHHPHGSTGRHLSDRGSRNVTIDRGGPLRDAQPGS